MIDWSLSEGRGRDAAAGICEWRRGMILYTLYGRIVHGNPIPLRIVSNCKVTGAALSLFVWFSSILYSYRDMSKS